MSGQTDAERQIKGVISGWLDAVRRKDVGAIEQCYVPDGRFLVPNAPIAEGRKAVGEMWRALLGMPNVTLNFGPTFIEAAASGDLAYEVGTYSLSFDQGAKRVEDRGKYVVVWKKHEGSWKAAADILNSDLPGAG